MNHHRHQTWWMMHHHHLHVLLPQVQTQDHCMSYQSSWPNYPSREGYPNIFKENLSLLHLFQEWRAQKILQKNKLLVDQRKWKRKAMDLGWIPTCYILYPELQYRRKFLEVPFLHCFHREEDHPDLLQFLYRTTFDQCILHIHIKEMQDFSSFFVTPIISKVWLMITAQEKHMPFEEG